MTINTNYVPSNKLRDEIDQCGLILQLFRQDLVTMGSYDKSNNGEFWIRVYIKIIFSLIEALLFRIKAMILAAHAEGIIKLSPDEAMLLKEVNYTIGDNGKAKERTAYNDFKSNMKFTLNTAIDKLGISSKVDYNDPGWGKLMDAIELRNQLTHPKNVHQLLVSSNDQAVVELAWTWFNVNFSVIVKEFNQKAI